MKSCGRKDSNLQLIRVIRSSPQHYLFRVAFIIRRTPTRRATSCRGLEPNGIIRRENPRHSLCLAGARTSYHRNWQVANRPSCRCWVTASQQTEPTLVRTPPDCGFNRTGQCLPSLSPFIRLMRETSPPGAAQSLRLLGSPPYRWDQKAFPCSSAVRRAGKRTSQQGANHGMPTCRIQS